MVQLIFLFLGMVIQRLLLEENAKRRRNHSENSTPTDMTS